MGQFVQLITHGRHLWAGIINMERPAEHSILLARTGFPTPGGNHLSPQDRDILHRYGYWLEGLAHGEIAPVTPEQEHFVQVSKGNGEPTTAFEQAWCRLQQSPSPTHMELSALVDLLLYAKQKAKTDHDEYQRRREAILAPVQTQLDSLDTEFASRTSKSVDEIEKLETEVRQAVVARGRSYGRGELYAMYTRQRVTWDSKGIAQYAETHPEIIRFRKISQPSVSLRYRPAGGQRQN